ncbi:IQ calmodulin-binding motif family protein [Musa troglodytarum]|uniref:IQ calmodulin-binding motif family protein n=1 Tax=Musa troglodytarum TaxID=320322 RepID=A0A9E7I3K2_9LILI|nr:IQ calmodulin-binding motif family protein [Musa troglodytarum]
MIVAAAAAAAASAIRRDRRSEAEPQRTRVRGAAKVQVQRHPSEFGSERTPSHDPTSCDRPVSEASRSQEEYSTRRTLGRWRSDQNALRSREPEATPGEGNLVIGGAGWDLLGILFSIAERRPCSKVPSFPIKPSKSPRICSPPRALSLPRFPTAEERERARQRRLARKE